MGKKSGVGFSRPALLPCTGSAWLGSARFGSAWLGRSRSLGALREAGRGWEQRRRWKKSVPVVKCQPKHPSGELCNARCEGQQVTGRGSLSSASSGHGSPCSVPPARPSLAAANFDFPDFLFRVRFMKVSSQQLGTGNDPARLPQGVKIALGVAHWLRCAEPRGCGCAPGWGRCHSPVSPSVPPSCPADASPTLMRGSRCVQWGQFARWGAPGVTQLLGADVPLQPHPCVHIPAEPGQGCSCLPETSQAAWGRHHGSKDVEEARLGAGKVWGLHFTSRCKYLHPSSSVPPCPQAGTGGGSDPSCEHSMSLPHPRAVPFPCLIPSGTNLR